jgi:hypothetical protein
MVWCIRAQGTQSDYGHRGIVAPVDTIGQNRSRQFPGIEMAPGFLRPGESFRARAVAE